MPVVPDRARALRRFVAVDGGPFPIRPVAWQAVPGLGAHSFASMASAPDTSNFPGASTASSVTVPSFTIIA